jgi:hypothetical protein
MSAALTGFEASNPTPAREVIRERLDAWWPSFLAAEQAARAVILAEQAFGRGRADEGQVLGGGPDERMGTE